MPPPNAFQFILLDMLNQSGLLNTSSPSSQEQPGQSSQQRGGSSVTGMGSVYSGDMPPMLWIQREQQRTTRTDAAAVSESNSIREQGNRAFREGKLTDAVRLYTEAIELDATNSFTFSNRALAYHKLGNNAAAVADAREAISLDAANYKAYFRLGLALAALGEYTEALSHLKVAYDHSSSNEDKESIQIQIAKCEAKLARTSTILTPLSPCTQSLPTCHPTTPTQPSNPSGGGAGDGTPVASPPSTPQPLMTTYATVLNLPEIHHVVQQIEERRKNVHVFLDDSLCSTLASVFDEGRAQQIKNLLGLANVDQIAKAVAKADEAQENLRRAARETNREQFQRAVLARDEALQSLWLIAKEAKAAVSKLKHMAADERTLLESIQRDVAAATTASGDGHPRCSPHGSQANRVTVLEEEDDEAASALKSPSMSHRVAECPATRIGDILREKHDIQRQMDDLAAAAAATNRAAIAFLEAAQSEKNLFENLSQSLGRWNSLREEVAHHARYFVDVGIHDSELNPAKMEALDSLGSMLQRVENEAVVFRKNSELGPQLLETEAQLERERLYQERQRIHLQAEIEWMRVKDEDPTKIGFMTQRLENARDRIAQLVEKQNELQRRIVGLIDSDHPELAWKALAGGGRMMKWVKGSGLWVNCAFSDFRILSTLSSTVSSKVYHASFKGEEVALKEIAMEGDKGRRRFQNEINITLGSSHHPNIIKIRSVFFDGPFAYVVMPYMRKGSLKSALGKHEALPWFRVQETLRQVASGLVHLHDRGVVHADIKPSNILFGDDNIPVIADFGIAKDYGRYGEREMTQTMSLSGTTDFMAPELLAPTEGRTNMPTAKSDVWSLGVTMYLVCAMNAALHENSGTAPSVPLPVLLPGASCVCVPPSVVGNNERLADLISQCLTLNPDQRPSATEILSHPYFAVSLIEDLVNNRELVESNAKLDAFRSYIHVLRAGTRSPSLISVVRGHMVESVSNIIDAFGESELLRPLMVVFQGESGVDEGALTTEMFALYFQQLVTRQKILVCSKTEGESDSESGEHGNSLVVGAEYTISSDPRIPEKHLVTIGKVLLKCMIENRPLPLQLNASVLKFLTGAEPTLSDMESYDRVQAQTLKRLLLMSSDDLEDAELSFGEFPATFIEKYNTFVNQSQVSDASVISSDTKVTSKNVKDFVHMKVKWELIGKREEALQLIKKGFLASPLLTPHIRLLSATELMLLLCGQQHLHADIIIGCLEFQGFPQGSRTPQHLIDLLKGSSQNNLRRFLRLCTSAVTIPHGGFSRKIKIVRTADLQRLPVGHGCVFQLDLPDYDDEAKLREKLGIALAHVNDGFHIA